MAKELQAEDSLRPGFFSSLVYPDYRRLWVGTALSQSANWALIVARAALTLEITGSTSWTGIITFAALIPALVCNPLGGYLADRFDRRKLLATTYALNAVEILVLAFAVAGGLIAAPGGMWLLLVLSVLNGSARAVQMPATQALLPNLVPRDRLLNAVALNQAMQQGSRMTGPLLTLPFILTVGPDSAFFLCSALYFLGFIQIMTIRTRSTGSMTQGRSILFNLVAGIHYVYTHPLLMSVVLLAVAHCALTMAFEALMPMLARERLGMSEGAALFAGPSYLMIGVGTGGFLGTFMLAGLNGKRGRGSALFLFGIASGITPAALAFAPNVPLAMMAAALVGAATSGFMALTHTTIQAIAPDAVRGRVISVNLWHTMAMMAGFNLVNGVLADVSWIDVQKILVFTGALFLVIMVLSVLRMHLRDIYLRGMPTPSYATA